VRMPRAQLPPRREVDVWGGAYLCGRWRGKASRTRTTARSRAMRPSRSPLPTAPCARTPHAHPAQRQSRRYAIRSPPSHKCALSFLNRSTPSTSSCAGAQAARHSRSMTAPPSRRACPTTATCWRGQSRCGSGDRERGGVRGGAEKMERERASAQGARLPPPPPPPPAPNLVSPFNFLSPLPFPSPFRLGHRHPLRRLHRPRRPPPVRVGLPRPARRVRGGQGAGRHVQG